MTAEAALQQFWESFGLSAFPHTAVPDDVVYPFLTYEGRSDLWGETVSSTVNLWYHTDSEAVPNAKAREIRQAIGIGGVTVPCDGGMIWIKAGNPFCQSINDNSDNQLKRRYINVFFEFLTM